MRVSCSRTLFTVKGWEFLNLIFMITEVMKRKHHRYGARSNGICLLSPVGNSLKVLVESLQVSVSLWELLEYLFFFFRIFSHVIYYIFDTHPSLQNTFLSPRFSRPFEMMYLARCHIFCLLWRFTHVLFCRLRLSIN